jgi:hypothetical protein
MTGGSKEKTCTKTAVMTLQEELDPGSPTATNAIGKAGNPRHAQMGLTSDFGSIFTKQDMDSLLKVMAMILRERMKGIFWFTKLLTEWI